MLKRLFASKKRPYFKNLNNMDRLIFDLSGSKLELSVPPQDWEFEENRYGDRFDIYDSRCYDYGDMIRESRAKSGLGTRIILKRDWESHGAIWASKPIGVLGCSVVINDISKIDQELNCFNKSQFEKIILYALHYTFGPGALNQKEYCSPVDWGVISRDEDEWVYLEAWPTKNELLANPLAAARYSVNVFAPLATDKYLSIVFYVMGSLPHGPSNRAMKSLISQIISGSSLHLSTEEKMRKIEAESKCGVSSYSASRHSEPWIYAQYRKGSTLKGEENFVLVSEGCPPPNLK